MNSIRNILRTAARCYHKGDHYVVNDQNIVEAVGDEDELYESLLKRFDLCLAEYPQDETFKKILRVLFKPEDIPVVTHIKTSPTLLDKLAKRVDLEYSELERIVEDLAVRGLLFRIKIGDHLYAILPEYIIGWYELALRYFADKEERVDEFNKANEGDIDFIDLLDHLEDYLKMVGPSYDPRCNMTPILRATPYSLDEEEPHYVVAYDTVVGLVENCEEIGITKCVCKFHEMEKKGEELPENHPLKCCLVANLGLESCKKIGYDEIISKEEALDLVKHCFDNDHMAHVDNSKSPVFQATIFISYVFSQNVICMCHKDYCGVCQGYYKTGVYVANPSKFLPTFDDDKCIGCGICVNRCPVDILELTRVDAEKVDKNGDVKKKLKPVVRMVEGGKEMCVGCLSCQYGCKVDAIGYITKDEELWAPVSDDMFEYTVRLSLDHGKFVSLVVDDPMSKVHDKIRGWLKPIERINE